MPHGLVLGLAWLARRSRRDLDRRCESNGGHGQARRAMRLLPCAAARLLLYEKLGLSHLPLYSRMASHHE